MPLAPRWSLFYYDLPRSSVDLSRPEKAEQMFVRTNSSEAKSISTKFRHGSAWTPELQCIRRDDGHPRTVRLLHGVRFSGTLSYSNLNLHAWRRFRPGTRPY